MPAGVSGFISFDAKVSNFTMTVRPLFHIRKHLSGRQTEENMIFYHKDFRKKRAVL